MAQQLTRIILIKEGAAIYATFEGNVLCCVVNADLINLVPWSHEEADTHLLLHLADAVKAGYRKECVRTVDTDVVILVIAQYNNFKPDELWMERTASLDSRMCSALHAFTGCDTVSSFGERPENSSHMAVVPKATGAFEDILPLLQDGIIDQTMSTLSIYPVLVYD